MSQGTPGQTPPASIPTASTQRPKARARTGEMPEQREQVRGIASPPREIWEYRTADSGRWLALFTMATFGRFATPTAAPCFARRSTIAERCGQSEDAVKSQIRKLREHGALESCGRGWAFKLAPSQWSDGTRPPAAPPPTVLGLASARGAGIARLMIAAWSFADYGAEDGAIVFPTAAELAARCGQSVRAVRDQLLTASRMGLVERVDVVALRLRMPSGHDASPTTHHEPTASAALSRGHVERVDAQPPAAQPQPWHHEPEHHEHEHVQAEPYDLAWVDELHEQGAFDDAIDLQDIDDGDPVDDPAEFFARFDCSNAAAYDAAPCDAQTTEQVADLHRRWNEAREHAATVHGIAIERVDLTEFHAARIVAALREHGADVVDLVLRHRSGEWSDNLESLTRWSKHVWAPKAVRAAWTQIKRRDNPRTPKPRRVKQSKQPE